MAKLVARGNGKSLEDALFITEADKDQPAAKRTYKKVAVADKEIAAMRVIKSALKGLDATARKRVLSWAVELASDLDTTHNQNVT